MTYVTASTRVGRSRYIRPDGWGVHTEDDARLFDEAPPARDTPPGSPGGAMKIGAVAADTPLVARLPPQPGQGDDDE